MLGSTIFAETLRRREQLLARVSANRATTHQTAPSSARRFGSHVDVEQTAAAQQLQQSHAAQQMQHRDAHDALDRLQASITTSEGQHVGMDRELLNELAAITHDEMNEPFDARRNRQLRTDLQTWIGASRQRVVSLNHEEIGSDQVTPAAARSALKEGVRAPLEVLRSEIRARTSARRSTQLPPPSASSDGVAGGAAGASVALHESRHVEQPALT